jgi:SAM-dependent methyltransferase
VVDDDLAQQAATARALAPTACAPTGCDWYHAAWPALRAHGLVAAPERNGEFFRDVLGSAAADGLWRVLVAGAADAGMLQIVLAAYAAAGVVPVVTVLDRCPTPVTVSVEHARRHGVEVEGWVSDIRTADRPAAFDVICTHGLLPMVPRADRPAVAAAWATLLRPGGRAITTSSLAGIGAPETSAFDAAAVDAFAARAGDAGGADLAELARRWAERAVAEPVRTAGELMGALEGAGLAVDLHVREIGGALPRQGSGPWTARSGVYAEIVATRPS